MLKYSTKISPIFLRSFHFPCPQLNERVEIRGGRYFHMYHGLLRIFIISCKFRTSLHFSFCRTHLGTATYGQTHSPLPDSLG